MTESFPVALDEHRSLVGRVEELLPRIDAVAQAPIAPLEAGGRVDAFGNGGSSTDAQHLSEELVGRFERRRCPLPIQSLILHLLLEQVDEWAAA